MEYISVMPHFHYDVAYLRTFEEYLPRSIDNIRAALDIAERYPEYTYFVEQTILLERFWNDYPAERERLRRLAAEGRLEVAPGMYAMPDMNLPGGESLFRQVRRGARWLREKLGLQPVTGWICDCFGHHPQVPQIMLHAGYSGYIFGRGTHPRPGFSSDFWWEGIDGSRILTHWMPLGYSAYVFGQVRVEGLGPGEAPRTAGAQGDLPHMARTVDHLASFSRTGMIFLGNGGDFVRPQEQAPEVVAVWNELHGAERPARFSLPERYLAELMLRHGPSLPVVHEEFNPWGQGCYSSRISIKQRNRALESRLQAAEALWTVLTQHGSGYPAQEFEAIWEDVLFNQFHDIICGTIIDPAFENVKMRYDRSEAGLDRLIDAGSLKIFNGQAGSRDGVSVFNPLCDDLARPVEVTLPEGSISATDSVYLRGTDGERLPAQVVAASRGQGQALLFAPAVPSLGTASFAVATAGAADEDSGLHTIRHDDGGWTLQNRFITARIASNGTVASLQYQEHEYIDQTRPWGGSLVMQHDNGDLWLLYNAPLNGGWQTATDLDDPLPPESATGPVFNAGIYSKNGQPQIELVESGPVRLKLRVSGSLNYWQIRIPYVQEIALTYCEPLLSFRTAIMPSGKHYRLRVAFPTPWQDGRIRHSIPFGACERPEGEFPVQHWLAYENGTLGLCLLNKGLPGNNVTDGTLILSLLRSAAMEYKGASESAYEVGVAHTFEYAIRPYRIEEAANCQAWGDRFNIPLLAGLWAMQPEAQRASLFSLDRPDTIRLAALYQDTIQEAEVVIARFYEASGKEAACGLQIGEGWAWERLAVAATNASGEWAEGPHETVQPGGQITLNFRPYQIITLRFAQAE